VLLETLRRRVEGRNYGILQAEILQDWIWGCFEFRPGAEEGYAAFLQENYTIGQFLRQMRVVRYDDGCFLKFLF